MGYELYHFKNIVKIDSLGLTYLDEQYFNQLSSINFEGEY